MSRTAPIPGKQNYRSNPPPSIIPEKNILIRACTISLSQRHGSWCFTGDPNAYMYINKNYDISKEEKNQKKTAKVNYIY